MGTGSAKALGLNGVAIKKAQIEIMSRLQEHCRHDGQKMVTPATWETKADVVGLAGADLTSEREEGKEMESEGSWIHSYILEVGRILRFQPCNPQDCDCDGFDSWSIPMIRLCYIWYS